MTMGPVNIRTNREGIVEIYDLYGRLMMRRKCGADETFSYHFTSGGVYIVRHGSEAVKVVVK